VTLRKQGGGIRRGDSLPSRDRNFSGGRAFPLRVTYGGSLKMGSGQAGKGMGNQASTGHQTSGNADPGLPDESEMTQQVQGNNQLQANDQIRARNERRGVPGETTKTQGVVESFELLDPKVRASRMLQSGGQQESAQR
jgi:hypothetical protein